MEAVFRLDRGVLIAQAAENPVTESVFLHPRAAMFAVRQKKPVTARVFPAMQTVLLVPAIWFRVMDSVFRKAQSAILAVPE